MGRRQTVQATLRTTSSPSPDKTVKDVTVDLRVTYPPEADVAQIEEMVYHAARQVIRELQHRAAAPALGLDHPAGRGEGEPRG